MIRLRLRTSSGLVTIQVSPTGDMSDLDEIIRNALQIPDDKDFDVFSAGTFPPKAIDMSLDVTIGEILQENETLTIQDRKLSGYQASAKGPLKKSRKSSTTSKSASSSSSSSLSSSGNMKNVMSLNTLPSSNKKTSSKKSVHSTQIPRTSNINTLANIEQRRRSRLGIQRNRRSTSSEPIDLGQQLVSAAGGESGALNQILRNDFTRAVQFRYEEATALARLTAAYNGSYSISRIENSSISTMMSTSLSSSSLRRPTIFQAQVSFGRGLGHRTNMTEVVEILTETMVREVLRAAVADEEGHGREVLKPKNMARQSPRIFWSLIYAKGSNINQAIMDMFPEITDWDWLTERPRELSAKALDNKRQAEEIKAMKLAIATKRQKTMPTITSTTTMEENSQFDISPSSIDGNINRSLLSSSNSNSSSSLQNSKQAFNQLYKEIENHISVEFIGDSFHEIVQTEYVDALVNVLGSDLVTALANADYNLSMRGKIIAANRKNPGQGPSMEQLESWIAFAQSHVIEKIWSICLCHSEHLRRCLVSLGITNPTSYLSNLLHEDEVDGLLWKVQGVDPTFDKLIIRNRSGAILLQYVKVMCEVVLKHYSWITEYNDRHENEHEHEEKEIDENDLYMGEVINEDQPSYFKGLEEEGWILDDTCEHNDDNDDDNNSSLSNYGKSYIGKPVLVWIDEEKYYYLPGTVIGYLPPTDDEPMALWKVQIHVPNIRRKLTMTSKDSRADEKGQKEEDYEEKEEDQVESRVWYEDLELDEIEAAMERVNEFLSYN